MSTVGSHPQTHLPRPRLTKALISGPAGVVLITAPAGYGKSALLAEAVDAFRGPAALLSLDRTDDDPGMLLQSLAAVVSKLGGGRPPDGADPAAAVRSMLEGVPAEPALLAIDDAHLLTSLGALETLQTLVRRRPPELRLVLAYSGRRSPALPRLPGSTDARRLTAEDVRLTAQETRGLLEAADRAGEADAAMATAFRGWPAGVALVATGDDAVAGVLDALPPEVARFLLETSILETLEPAVCDAVRCAHDSAHLLAELALDGVMVERDAGANGGYRLAGHFGRAVRSELGRRGIPSRPLHLRAAAWFGANDRPAEQISHLLAAGEREAAADVVAAQTMGQLTLGRLATVETWLAEFPAAMVRGRAPLALAAAWTHAFRGEPGAALSQADRAERAGWDGRLPDGSGSIEAAVSVLRSAVCSGALDDAASYAARAVELEPAGSPWRPSAFLQLGTIRLIAADLPAARAAIERARELAAGTQPAVEAAAVVYLALIETREGDGRAAARLADVIAAAIEMPPLRDFPPLAYSFGVLGAVEAEVGDAAPATRHLLHAAELLGRERLVFPPADVWVRTLMAVAWNKLGRPAEARRLLVEARRTLARHDLDPLLGSLVGQAEAACEAVAGLSEPLTPRELEILRLLAAVQSLNDIAAALVVSVNTVKSHVRSIYSKLRVTSRRDAVRRAAELGLIESPRT